MYFYKILMFSGILYVISIGLFWLEHLTHNQVVPGSSPGGPTETRELRNQLLFLCKMSAATYFSLRAQANSTQEYAKGS